VSEEIYQERQQSGPAVLATLPNSGSLVAVEILVEQDVVTPIAVGLELFRSTINRPTSTVIPEENLSQPLDELLHYLEQVHQIVVNFHTAFNLVLAIIFIAPARQLRSWLTRILSIHPHGETYPVDYAVHPADFAGARRSSVRNTSMAQQHRRRT
jgi:hypothetical protein